MTYPPVRASDPPHEQRITAYATSEFPADRWMDGRSRHGWIGFYFIRSGACCVLLSPSPIKTFPHLFILFILAIYAQGCGFNLALKLEKEQTISNLRYLFLLLM